MFPTVEIPDGDLDRADLSAWMMCPPLDFGIAYLAKFVSQGIRLFPIVKPIAQVWFGFTPTAIFVNEYRYEPVVP